MNDEDHAATSNPGVSEPSPSFIIDSDNQTRKGAHADFVMARSNGGITMLDFVLSDMPADNGPAQCVLVSRVFMSNDGIAQLRDMLIQHTSAWADKDDKSAH